MKIVSGNLFLSIYYLKNIGKELKNVKLKYLAFYWESDVRIWLKMMRKLLVSQ